MPVYESYSQANVTAGTQDSVSCPLPSGTVDADILVAIAGCNTSRNIIGPAGWDTLVNTSGDGVAAFTVQASEVSGNQTFQTNNTYGQLHATISRISGAAKPTTATSGVESGYSSSVPCQDVTVTTSGDMAIWGGMISTADGFTAADRGTLEFDGTPTNAAAASMALVSETINSTDTQTGPVLSGATGSTIRSSVSIPVPAAAAASTTTVSRIIEIDPDTVNIL